jgi:hypothetical protein
MKEYIAREFICETPDEIWHMYQFITGELFVFVDNLMTLDEVEVKGEKMLMEVQEVVTVYMEMYLLWLKVVPKYSDWCKEIVAHPLLYMVSPEAAIIRLGESIISIMTIIISGSIRSRVFYKKSNQLLRKKSLPESIVPYD